MSCGLLCLIHLHAILSIHSVCLSAFILPFTSLYVLTYSALSCLITLSVRVLKIFLLTPSLWSMRSSVWLLADPWLFLLSRSSQYCFSPFIYAFFTTRKSLSTSCIHRIMITSDICRPSSKLFTELISKPLVDVDKIDVIPGLSIGWHPSCFVDMVLCGTECSCDN